MGRALLLLEAAVTAAGLAALLSVDVHVAENQCTSAPASLTALLVLLVSTTVATVLLARRPDVDAIARALAPLGLLVVPAIHARVETLAFLEVLASPVV